MLQPKYSRVTPARTCLASWLIYCDLLVWSQQFPPLPTACHPRWQIFSSHAWQAACPPEPWRVPTVGNKSKSRALPRVTWVQVLGLSFFVQQEQWSLAHGLDERSR